MSRTLFVILLLAQLAGIAGAQGIVQRRTDFSCENCRPGEALVRLSRETGINIVFSDRLFEGCSAASWNFRQVPAVEVLDRITACARVSYRVVGNQVVFFSFVERHSISGYVEDAETGERLIGAGLLLLNGGAHRAITNEFGFFSLREEEGEYRIQASYVGYKPLVKDVSLTEDRKLQIRLEPDTRLREVVISAGQSGDARERRSGSPRYLNLKEMRRLPMPGGEADLLRQTALLPGVQTGTDGIGGLHIRGGNADQNLFLLDDVPVYSPSHALGLFSIYNPSTVSSVKLWKGDFPARYGGRASSVLDVRTREGNMHEYKGELNTGLFASSAVVEGPLVEGKSSFLLGGRMTYFEPWVNYFSKRGNLLTFSGDDVRYRFYDGNIRLNYTLSDRDRVYFSYYRGGDVFKNDFEQSYNDPKGYITDKSRLATDWGNSIAALRWNHLLRDNLFTNTTVRYSRFTYQSRLGFRSDIVYPNGKTYELANYGQLYRTLIRDWSWKTDFTWYVSAPLTVRWGASWTSHNFQPGVITANFLQPGQTGSNVDSLASILLNNEKLGARETDGYVEGEWEFARHFRLEAGLNTAYFQVRDADYTVFQPRLRINRKGGGGWSQWAGYHRTAQFLHQIGTFNISLPFELWVPSTAKAPPEQVDQYSFGTGKQAAGWNWQAEFYYKSFNRVLTFISSGDALYTGGAVDASGWEDRIASGTGTSRGIEITAEKLTGKTRGGVVYTLSRSDRLFPDLNSGRPFPYRFDRLHDLKITLRQELTDWLEADVIWGFATGNPITLTGVKFRHESVEGEVQREVFFYTEVNGYRLPVYHRLDLAFNARWGHGNVKHALQLGTYNTYNRANPFYLYIDAGSSVKGKAIQFTLLPLLPVFRYEIKF